MEKKAIEIPGIIYKKIEEKLKDTDFNSISNYIIYILREVVLVENEEEEMFAKDEEKELKERLRSLGYME